MSTNTNTDANTNSTTDDVLVAGHTHQRTLGRVRRRVALLVAILSLGTAAGALTSAQPAAAASGVGYCFKTRTGMIVAPATTYLELYYNGRWNRVAAGSTSTWNGCGSFTMSGSYQSYYSRVSLSLPRCSLGQHVQRRHAADGAAGRGVRASRHRHPVVLRRPLLRGVIDPHSRKGRALTGRSAFVASRTPSGDCYRFRRAVVTRGL